MRLEGHPFGDKREAHQKTFSVGLHHDAGKPAIVPMPATPD
jgi:hypothetical protein